MVGEAIVDRELDLSVLSLSHSDQGPFSAVMAMGVALFPRVCFKDGIARLLRSTRTRARSRKPDSDRSERASEAGRCAPPATTLTLEGAGG